MAGPVDRRHSLSERLRGSRRRQGRGADPAFRPSRDAGRDPSPAPPGNQPTRRYAASGAWASRNLGVIVVGFTKPLSQATLDTLSLFPHQLTDVSGSDSDYFELLRSWWVSSEEDVIT